MEQKPEDQQGGFETASELRREAEYARRAEARMGRPRSLGVGRAWAVVLIAVVVVGLVIYFLVTSL